MRAVGTLHIIHKTTARSSPRKLDPPPRLITRYTISHVPAYLPEDWYDQYLAQLPGLIPARLLRRAAAIHLPARAPLPPGPGWPNCSPSRSALP